MFILSEIPSQHTASKLQQQANKQQVQTNTRRFAKAISYFTVQKQKKRTTSTYITQQFTILVLINSRSFAELAKRQCLSNKYHHSFSRHTIKYNVRRSSIGSH